MAHGVCLFVCVCVQPSGAEPVYARVQKPNQYGDVQLDTGRSSDIDSWVWLTGNKHSARMWLDDDNHCCPTIGQWQSLLSHDWAV